MVACHFSIWEVEAGESVVQNYSQLHSEFEANLGCLRSCIKIDTVSLLILFHGDLGKLCQTSSLCALLLHVLCTYQVAHREQMDSAGGEDCFSLYYMSTNYCCL